MSQNVKKMYILGYLGVPEGVFNDQTGPILLSSYPLTHIYVHVKLDCSVTRNRKCSGEKWGKVRKSGGKFGQSGEKLQ